MLATVERKLSRLDLAVEVTASGLVLPTLTLLSQFLFVLPLCPLYLLGILKAALALLLVVLLKDTVSLFRLPLDTAPFPPLPEAAVLF